MTQSRNTIVIGLETKTRELKSKTLLAACLCERGFEVVIVEAYPTSADEIIAHGAVGYLDRNTFLSNREKFARLVSKGVTVFCLDEEGAVWFEPFLYLNRLSARTCKNTDLFFTWGQRHTQLAMSRLRRSQIRETGNPRFDLLGPALRSLFSEDVARIRDRYGRFVLVSSNFGQHHRFGDRHLRSTSELRRKRLLRGDAEVAFYQRLFDHRQTVLEEMKNLIQRVAEEYPNLAVVIRPHPSENPDPWYEYFKSVKNVHVVFEGELESWIIAAEAVIHNSCTSGLEAYYLGTPSYAFVPCGTSYEAELPTAASTAESSCDELIAKLKAPQLMASDARVVNECVAHDDGYWSADRIADEIVGALGPRRGLFRFRAAVYSWSIRSARIVARVLRRLRGIHAPVEKGLEQKNKMPGMDASEVNQILGTLQSASGRFKGIVARNATASIVISPD